MPSLAIESYLNYRHPEVNGELFRQHGLGRLYDVLEDVLDAANELGLQHFISDAKVEFDEIKLISSLKADSVLITENSSACIFIDYECHLLFMEFCTNGINTASTLERMACQQYFCGDYEFALRLRLLRDYEELFCSPINSFDSSVMPVFGEAFAMSSLASHEIGHVFFYCQNRIDCGGAIDALNLVSKATTATLQFGKDWALMEQLPDSFRNSILNYDPSCLDDVLLEEIYCDACGTDIKHRVFHWPDRQEVHYAEALLGVVLVSAFSFWKNSTKLDVRFKNDESLKAELHQCKLRYSTVVRAGLTGKDVISVGSALAKKIWRYIEEQKESLKNDEQNFYLDISLNVFSGGQSSDMGYAFVPAWAFLVYCDFIYSSFSSGAMEVFRKCADLVVSDSFSSHLECIRNEEEALASFLHLSQMDQLVDLQVLQGVIDRLPISEEVPLPTWVPLIYQVAGEVFLAGQDE